MKIFLTGSSGFIGFHLSKKLLDPTLLKKLTEYNPKISYKVGIKKFLKCYFAYYKY